MLSLPSANGGMPPLSWLYNTRCKARPCHPCDHRNQAAQLHQEKNEAPKKKVRPLPILRGRGHSTKGLQMQRCHVAKALCASCLILTNTRCKAGSEWAAALGWTTTLCLPSDLATAWLQLGNTLSPHQALFKLCAALANPTHAYDFQALAVRLQSHSINLLTHSIVRDGT